MIISRTPFRISLAGGGSDLADYYRHRSGQVVSFAIDRYMYVTVNRRFEKTIRVSYTRTEIVDHIDDLQHDIIREALRMSGLTSGIEITTIADLPAGIGLGSSSALTVGTLNALSAFKGEWSSPAELARRACELEIRVLGRPIGKQDQYIAAFGGLHAFEFHADESVPVRPVVCSTAARARLMKRLLLFFTGTQRDASGVLKEARRRLAEDVHARCRVDGLVDIARRVERCLTSGHVDVLGRLLDESWCLKKQMGSRVSSPAIDHLYAGARRAGALGGKIAGAGGGGCLLLFATPQTHPRVRTAMRRAGLREVPFNLEPEGSRIIHYAR